MTYSSTSASKTGYRQAFDASRTWSGSTSSAGAHTHTVTVNATGSGSAHNNMPPYLAVYCWRRTA